MLKRECIRNLKLNHSEIYFSSQSMCSMEYGRLYWTIYSLHIYNNALIDTCLEHIYKR